MTRGALFTEKDKELKRQMKSSGVYIKDIKEKFVRSSGPGGQNVNKVSSCVVLVHIPTGIQVKCQEERSQVLNRHQARWMLLKKIQHHFHQLKLQQISQAEKKKRQNRKRSTFSKEITLKEKAKRSDKKVRRKKVSLNQVDQF